MIDLYFFPTPNGRKISIALEELGVPRVDGGPAERDHRKIWQIFAEKGLFFAQESLNHLKMSSNTSIFLLFFSKYANLRLAVVISIFF